MDCARKTLEATFFHKFRLYVVYSDSQVWFDALVMLVMGGTWVYGGNGYLKVGLILLSWSLLYALHDFDA